MQGNQGQQRDILNNYLGRPVVVRLIKESDPAAWSYYLLANFSGYNEDFIDLDFVREVYGKPSVDAKRQFLKDVEKAEAEPQQLLRPPEAITLNKRVVHSIEEIIEDLVEEQ